MSERFEESPFADLVAVMAHDINNPLAALVTNLGFLGSTLPPEIGDDAREALADAQMLCDVLRRLSSNLDLLARRDDANRGFSPCDLTAFARDAMARLEAQARVSEVVFAEEPGARAGEVLVDANREFFVRTLDNMLAFAIERARPRSRIDVGVDRSSGLARVTVRFEARSKERPEEPSPLDASSVARRRFIQATYGRGLALYCARLAASLLGARVEVSDLADGRSALCLVASAGERG